MNVTSLLKIVDQIRFCNCEWPEICTDCYVLYIHRPMLIHLFEEGLLCKEKNSWIVTEAGHNLVKVLDMLV